MDMVGDMKDMVGKVVDMVGEVVDMVGEVVEGSGLKANLPGIPVIPGDRVVLCRNATNVSLLVRSHSL